MNNQEILVNVVAASLNITALDFEKNYAKHLEILRAVDATASNQADLTAIVFPAMSLSGIGCQDAFLRPSVLRRTVATLFELEKKLSRNSVVAIGIPLAFRGKLYQATAFFADQKLRGFVCAKEGELIGKDDSRQFAVWESGKVSEIILNGRRFPIGDLAFQEKGVLFEIRAISLIARKYGEQLDPFDVESYLDDRALYAAMSSSVPTDARPTSEMVRGPALVLEEGATATRRLQAAANATLCPGAVPFAIGRQAKIRKALKKASEREGGIFVYGTPIGVESGTFIYDGGSAIAANGDVIQQERFSFHDVSIVFQSFRFSPASSSANRVVERASNVDAPLSNNSVLENWETSESVAFEEFARATSFGMFDYMRKSRSKGFTLSMSGGADSATIASLVRIGVAIGTRKGSPLGFLRWLADASDVGKLFPQLTDLATSLANGVRVDDPERAIIGLLLETVYQATRNSGEVTRRAARAVAEECGANHYEFNVDGVVEEYKKIVAEATGNPFSWERDDLALQNIQARGRAPSAWLLANRSGRILLATSNRSEVACGYATMDGDTCGGLSPIAGVEKAFIRRWLKWMEKEGLSLGKTEKQLTLPALRYINEQQPTAELRPAEAKQTDEADLMPYPILNMFERALIRDRLELPDAYRRVLREAREAGFDLENAKLLEWGALFCKLWSATQWKRQRYAPGFSLDDYDLFPGSWTRFPILSGGFRFEADVNENDLEEN